MAFEIIKRRLAARDIQALEELFSMFYEPVYKSAYFVCRDRAIAEDVVQDTFLKAYDKIGQLKDSSRVESWLIRIAMNKARDQLRSRKRQAVVPENESGFAGQADDLPENRILAREEHSVLNAAINDLAPEYQEVVFLKYTYEFTIKRISEMLDIPEGTVKTRLRKARTLLEEALRAAEIEEPRSEGGEPLAQRTKR